MIFHQPLRPGGLGLIEIADRANLDLCYPQEQAQQVGAPIAQAHQSDAERLDRRRVDLLGLRTGRGRCAGLGVLAGHGQDGAGGQRRLEEVPAVGS